MEQSLFDLLQQYDRTMLPFHMPGHKRNVAIFGENGYLAALGAECDITEIEGFDNLAEPTGVLKELKERVAKLYRSEQTELLVNGSTCGILAAIEATVPYGGTVVMARNCHKAVYNGLRLKNAKIRYLLPPVDGRTGIAGAVSAETVRQALCRNGKELPEEKEIAAIAGQAASSDGQAFGQEERVSLLILTSPTYEGISSDVRAICELAHGFQIPVLVDAAHGAHFGFGCFPKSAVTAGADLVVQSLHKTLPSLTQTALLHRNGTLVSAEKVRQAVNTFQTSSPSYLFLASIDGCLRLMEKKELWENWEAALDLFYERAKAWKVLSLPVMKAGQACQESARAAGKEALLGQACQENARAAGKESLLGQACQENAQAADKSKLVIGTERAGKSGAWLMDKLRKDYRIELEMAAGRYVIAMTGAGDTKETVSRLADALDAIDRELQSEKAAGKNPVAEETGGVPDETGKELAVEKAGGRTEDAEHFAALSYPEIVFTAAETESSPQEECLLAEAEGKIAAEYVFAYPPGVPLVVPGERITKEVLRLFAWNRENGIVLHGMKGVISDGIFVAEEKLTGKC